jgi:AcrR family transcriptional regulator
MTKRRADAERNIAAILAAASEMFGRGDAPAMADIAGAAGVRRATLYAHFPSREELLDAVVLRSIEEADAALTGLRLDDDAPEVAVTRVLESLWPVLDRHRRLRQVALAELGPERLRGHHDRAMQHVEALIARGQEDGTFRTDLRLDWLVASFYAVLHAAADETDAGRLGADDVPALLVPTILSLLAPARRRTKA